MNAQEIVAAAHVRELAIQIRKAAATREKDQQDASGGIHAGMSYNDFLALYNRTHPITEFVPIAIAELREIHEAITHQP